MKETSPKRPLIHSVVMAPRADTWSRLKRKKERDLILGWKHLEAGSVHCLMGEKFLLYLFTYLFLPMRLEITGTTDHDEGSDKSGNKEKLQLNLRIFCSWSEKTSYEVETVGCNRWDGAPTKERKMSRWYLRWHTNASEILTQGEDFLCPLLIGK